MLHPESFRGDVGAANYFLREAASVDMESGDIANVAVP